MNLVLATLYCSDRKGLIQNIMKWNLSETDYPQIDIAVQHIGGLAAWFEKILDLAPNYTSPWNVLIADLWPNGDMSRLIGHVQMDDVSVGYDTVIESAPI